MNDDRITYFAETDARNKKVDFGIKAKDRTKHVYVIGKTGMGKSTLLENMAVQDIKNGEGMAFIDPHGKSADLLLEYVPPERIKDVIYFAPFDTDYPISFNVLESVDPDKRHLVVSGLMSTFKKIWQDAWSARMEYILTNTLLALLEYPGATLLGVNRMLADKDFRRDVIEHVSDISVKNFWVKEFASYTERMALEAVPAIQNKIGQFTANALIRNMIGQPQSSFDIRKMMDNKKIMIINLSKGRIGESNANLLGGMLITKIYLAALSRADVPDRVLRTLPNFYLYVDEFQSFANESFADILSEARKYKLNLTIAHQYIEQMEEEVRAAVFGNVGTMIIFRVGAYDAEILEKEFAPTFTEEDIVNLGFTQIYLKLMIDGISSPPFSATTLPPIAVPAVSNMEAAIAASREQFAHKRSEVEKAIVEWHQPVARAVVAKTVAVGRSSAGKVAETKAVGEKAGGAISSLIQPQTHTSTSQLYNPPQLSEISRPPRRDTTTASTTSTTSPTQTQPPSFQANQAKSRPFKEALRKAADESLESRDVASAPAPASAPISLSTLSKNRSNIQPPVKNDQKNPTPKNVNDLKSALASIIGGDKVASTVIGKAGKIREAQNPPVPKEVPKDVLENILKVN